MDAGAFFFFDGFDDGVGGEDRVEMCGEEDAGGVVGLDFGGIVGPGRVRGVVHSAADGETVLRFGRDYVLVGVANGFGAEFRQDIARIVEVDIGQAELLEAVEEPGGANGFAEGWGGDAHDLELPLAELGLVEVQPVEGAVNRGEGGEACYAALGRGGGGHLGFHLHF